MSRARPSVVLTVVLYRRALVLRPALKGLKTSPGPQSLLDGSRSLKHVQGDVRSRGDGLQSCGDPSAPAGPSGALSQSPVAASSPRTSLRRFPGKRLDQPQVASASASATTTASGRAVLTRPQPREAFRRVEDCFPHLLASIAASIAPQRVTPQSASSYGLHGADPASVPYSSVTPPRVTLYGKLYLQR